MSVAIRTATRIADLDDFGSVPGAGNDGYALTWDNGAGAFVLTEMAASGLAADGSVTGATAQAQAFTNGIIGPSWKPSANSTTALQLQNAAGTPLVTLDTTNSRVGVGTSAPAYKCEVNSAGASSPMLALVNTSNGSFSFSSFVLIAGANINAGIQLIAAPSSYTGITGWASSGGLTTGTFLTGGLILNASAGGIKFQTSTVERLRIDMLGLVGIGTTTPGSLLHGLLTSAATNAVTNVLTIGHDTTGTAAAGFGAGQLFALESSTTAAQNAARIQALWYDATHATRKADLVGTAYDAGGEREGWRVRGAGSEPALGFYGVTPVVRAVLATGAGASVDDVISALQALGLVKQS